MQKWLLVLIIIGLIPIVLFGRGWLMQSKAELILLSDAEQLQLLQFARRHLGNVLSGESEIVVNIDSLSVNLKKQAACFLTLTKDGALRGCIIDDFRPHEPLYKNVLRNVVLAATADQRFSPVRVDELDKIKIEISVLDIPRPLAFDDPEELPERLNPGKDGVILTTATGTSTYLPHVWEQFPDPVEFLSSLCEKQGACTDCWQTSPLPRVEIYHVFHFAEGDISL
jgi:AmmeMemoRadiSam system protein A